MVALTTFVVNNDRNRLTQQELRSSHPAASLRQSADADYRRRQVRAGTFVGLSAS
jgi:hypothetical protein